MKVQVLNKLLTSERVYGAKFPFPPIALPVNDNGEICQPHSATKTHYTTIVLLLDEDVTPAIFEFSQEVMDGLLAYAKRHKGLDSVEILLSREDDSGKIRMRIGATEDDWDNVQILASPYQNMYDCLYGRYMERMGKKLNDT